VLTVALMVAHKVRGAAGKPKIPYGVAIAFGGLAILTQRFLNQFA
jgi:prepilin peptidase CpaA